jgi:Cys-rich repeat protein
VVTGCNYLKATNGTAVVCEGLAAGGAVTACAPQELQVCSSNADCPSGRTCTPTKWKLFQVGLCQ